MFLGWNYLFSRWIFCIVVGFYFCSKSWVVFGAINLGYLYLYCIITDISLLSSVYSSWEVGKLQCFSWIKGRFSGQSVKFCVIGDGSEECEAAETMGWPFVGIDLRPDGSNRFPGLTMKTVNYYLDVIYGDLDVENDEQCLWHIIAMHMLLQGVAGSWILEISGFLQVKKGPLSSALPSILWAWLWTNIL